MNEDLTADDLALLAFEGGDWWRYRGTKEQAIRSRFGSVTSYYFRLNWLIDRPAAALADPALVNRLRRLRATRQGVPASPRLIV